MRQEPRTGGDCLERTRSRKRIGGDVQTEPEEQDREGGEEGESDSDVLRKQ